MTLKTAEEIMVPIRKYPHIPDSMTLGDAIVIMRKPQIDARDGRKTAPRVLLVFNEELQFVGLLRRRDIMRGLQPSFLFGDRAKLRHALFPVSVDAELGELSWEKVASGMRQRIQRRVKDYMIPITATINHDDHLVKIMNQLVRCDTSVIPVIKQDKVIGMVRSIDVLYEIALFLEIEQGPPATSS